MNNNKLSRQMDEEVITIDDSDDDEISIYETPKNAAMQEDLERLLGPAITRSTPRIQNRQLVVQITAETQTIQATAVISKDDYSRKAPATVGTAFLNGTRDSSTSTHRPSGGTQETSHIPLVQPTGRSVLPILPSIQPTATELSVPQVLPPRRLPTASAIIVPTVEIQLDTIPSTSGSSLPRPKIPLNPHGDGSTSAARLYESPNRSLFIDTESVQPVERGRRWARRIYSASTSTSASRPSPTSSTSSALTSGTSSSRIVDPELDFDFPKRYYGRLRNGSVKIKEAAEIIAHYSCQYCDDIIIGNTSFMAHVLAHVIWNNEDEGAYETHTRCYHCWRLFEDPFSLAEHIDEVHRQRNDVAACYICELSFDDVLELKDHMLECHWTGFDAPYACKLCTKANYRSALYSDIRDHFITDHRNTLWLLCPLCLATFEGTCRTNNDKKFRRADTSRYFNHLTKHEEVGDKYRCGRCKLKFINEKALADHIASQHRRWEQGSRLRKRNRSDHSVEMEGFRPLTELEAKGEIIAPSRLREQEKEEFETADALCIECRRFKMDKYGHYSKRIKSCTKCRYATYCTHAFKIHTMQYHNNPIGYSLLPPLRSTALLGSVSCACGYASQDGSVLAHHAAMCSVSNGTLRIRYSAGGPSTHSTDRVASIPEEFLTAVGLRRVDDDRTAATEKRGNTNITNSSRLDVIPKSSVVARHDTSMTIELDKPALVKLHNRRRLWSPEKSFRRSDSNASSTAADIASTSNANGDGPSMSASMEGQSTSRRRRRNYNEPFVSVPKMGPRRGKLYKRWETKYLTSMKAAEEVNEECIVAVNRALDVERTHARLAAALREFGTDPDDVMLLN